MPSAINTSPQSSQRQPPPVRKPFDQWTLLDAKAMIDWTIQRRLGRDGFIANWRFAEDHDHLQDMKGWIGPEGADNTTSRSRNQSGWSGSSPRWTRLPR
jgi:hypothetical protein